MRIEDGSQTKWSTKMKKYVKRAGPAAILLGMTGTLWAEDSGTKVDQDDPEALRCEYTKVVNSRIPQKICLTNFEWEERRRAQIEAERSARNHNSACTAPRC